MYSLVIAVILVAGGEVLSNGPLLRAFSPYPLELSLLNGDAAMGGTGATLVLISTSASSRLKRPLDKDIRSRLVLT